MALGEAFCLGMSKRTFAQLTELWNGRIVYQRHWQPFLELQRSEWRWAAFGVCPSVRFVFGFLLTLYCPIGRVYIFFCKWLTHIWPVRLTLTVPTLQQYKRDPERLWNRDHPCSILGFVHLLRRRRISADASSALCGAAQDCFGYRGCLIPCTPSHQLNSGIISEPVYFRNGKLQSRTATLVHHVRTSESPPLVRDPYLCRERRIPVCHTASGRSSTAAIHILSCYPSIVCEFNCISRLWPKSNLAVAPDYGDAV